MIRRRKIEYDAVTEKVNTLPSREELEQSIASLENDMVAIRSEHDTQNRRIQAQKVALDGVIADLGAVNMLGKDKESSVSRHPSPMPTPVLDLDTTMENDAGSPAGGLESDSEELGESGEVEDKEDGEGHEVEEALLLSASNSLNPAADPFIPGKSLSTSLDDDIEMGEVAEDPRIKGKKKARDEELEEGEASDSSSALSDPPDD